MRGSPFMTPFSHGTEGVLVPRGKGCKKIRVHVFPVSPPKHRIERLKGPMSGREARVLDSWVELRSHAETLRLTRTLGCGGRNCDGRPHQHKLLD